MRMSPSEFEALRKKGMHVVGGQLTDRGRVDLMPLSPRVQAIAEGMAAAEPLLRAAKARTTVNRPAWAQQHKFNAQRTELAGLSFPSKTESQYFTHLQELKAAGTLVFFLWQVPFLIPGKPRATRLVLDAVEFWADGTITFTDVKGMLTETFKVKRRSIQALYPITIRTVKKRKAGWLYSET